MCFLSSFFKSVTWNEQNLFPSWLDTYVCSSYNMICVLKCTQQYHICNSIERTRGQSIMQNHRENCSFRLVCFFFISSFGVAAIRYQSLVHTRTQSSTKSIQHMFTVSLVSKTDNTDATVQTKHSIARRPCGGPRKSIMSQKLPSLPLFNVYSLFHCF